ncbi:MAG: MFS transporter [Caldilineaceae bacterium]|nr:MFS transporter [Caldilineaceae bacterium]
MILQTVLTSMFRTLLFRPGQNKSVVPDELRAYFSHLYWDVAWFGIVAGSSQAFLGVYVARLGATPLQMGLLNAGPALVGLLFTMPAGLWLQRQRVGRAVFWSAAVSRIQFLLWALLPGLLPAQGQVWSFLALVLLFTIPATVLAISFNAMYAAAVPVEYRGQVAGTRNALLALVYVVTSLVSGWLLNTLPMTLGYQVIFGLGCLGAAMSTYHLWHLRRVNTESILEPEKIRTSIGDLARPGDSRMTGMNLRTNVGLRVFSRGVNLLRFEVLRGSYGKVVAAFFVFHFAQFLPIPVFPLFWVDVAQFSDWEIGIGTAVFHSAVLMGSLQFVRLARRWDNRRLTAISTLLLSAYPLLAAFSVDVPLLVVTSVLGGLAWSVTAGSLGNYLLEQAPEGDRPAYLAWYNLALNAAVLTGSLSGSFLAEWVGLVPTLLLAAALRALSGIALWRWH